jgi:nucleoside-diphosphate-sugar epimerase
MLIAVTGATGFLGRYLVRHLSGGDRLRCWHRPDSDRSGFESAAGPIDWSPGQLGDASAARELVRRGVGW